MNKLVELDVKKYDKYVKNHPTKSHFLQSYAWGEFAKKEKNQTPYYMGLVDSDNNILGTALLLQKHLPFGYSYFYSPRGFVIDFKDQELLKEFTSEIVKFAKSKKGIFVKIDPDLIWNSENYKGEKVEVEYNSKEIFDNLKRMGFKHLGFTKNFETNQPRYTFRIDMNKSLEEIEDAFSKTTKQRIAKAESLETKVRLGDSSDIVLFHHLMELTESRKDFVSHDLKYYQSLYDIYNKTNKMNLFIGSVDIKKIIKKYKKEKTEIDKEINTFDDVENLSKSAKNKLNELIKKRDKLEKDINEYLSIHEKYKEDEMVLNGHVIMEYGDKAWVLYAGNHNELTSSYSNYKVYNEHIKYCHEHGIKMYDQFGTIGDLSSNNPRLGLHEFKKKFGGDYVEFIGEFDYIINPFMYFCFTKLVPLYRNIVKSIAKKNIKKSISKNEG